VGASGVAAMAEITRPECIAPANPGGGFDLTCRIAQAGLAEQIKEPIQVTFMPGGIGAVAYNLFNTTRTDDPNAIVAFSTGSLLNIATGKYGAWTENDVRWLASAGTDYGAVVVKADSPIRTPKDLEGKTIGGPGNDGALKLFPAFAKAAKIDAAKVNVTNMAPNLREQMLMRGQVDAAFGFINTIWFSAKLTGVDPDKQLRFIKYVDHGMDLGLRAINVAVDAPFAGGLETAARPPLHVDGDHLPGLQPVVGQAARGDEKTSR
jgi:tripartite-type tricarboxylate transporter receptor subunit TctC